MKKKSAFSRMVVGRPDLNPIWLRTWLLMLQMAAWLWRRLLLRTTLVAVTGSAGKTTAKEFLGVMLSSAAPTVRTFDTRNDSAHGVPSTVLRIRPWTRYAVIEVGAHRPNVIRKSGRLIRPHIVIVTTVNHSHPEAYESPEAVAREKAQLLDELQPDGIAILGGDNPFLAGIAANHPGRIFTFGCAPGNDLRATDILSAWPDRLEFSAHCANHICRVRTRLVGAHYLNSVLAALSGAICCGISLSRAVKMIEGLEPHHARTQPVLLPSGATMLRDDFGGNWFHFDAALDVLAQARADRRIAVLGAVGDFGTPGRDNWRKLGAKTAASADAAVFVGKDAGAARSAAVEAGMPADRAYSFTNLKPAAEFLRSELCSGDLVLLKGGRATEHLTRLYFSQTGSVDCWVRRCQKPILCDFCKEMGHRPDSHSGRN